MSAQTFARSASSSWPIAFMQSSMSPLIVRIRSSLGSTSAR